MKIKTTFLVLLAGSISSMHALETQKVSKTYGEIEKRLGELKKIKQEISKEQAEITKKKTEVSALATTAAVLYTKIGKTKQAKSLIDANVATVKNEISTIIKEQTSTDALIKKTASEKITLEKNKATFETNKTKLTDEQKKLTVEKTRLEKFILQKQAEKTNTQNRIEAKKREIKVITDQLNSNTPVEMQVLKSYKIFTSPFQTTFGYRRDAIKGIKMMPNGKCHISVLNDGNNYPTLIKADLGRKNSLTLAGSLKLYLTERETAKNTMQIYLNSTEGIPQSGYQTSVKNRTGKYIYFYYYYSTTQEEYNRHIQDGLDQFTKAKAIIPPGYYYRTFNNGYLALCGWKELNWESKIRELKTAKNQKTNTLNNLKTKLSNLQKEIPTLQKELQETTKKINTNVNVLANKTKQLTNTSKKLTDLTTKLENAKTKKTNLALLKEKLEKMKPAKKSLIQKETELKNQKETEAALAEEISKKYKSIKITVGTEKKALITADIKTVEKQKAKLKKQKSELAKKRKKRKARRVRI